MVENAEALGFIIHPSPLSRPIELLAPARDAEVGREAILHGADAVYIGGPSFGARAAAGNSVADIAALCAFAHIYDARVYVTLNTILYDGEVEEARALIQQLYEAGVDALITQDAALPELQAEGRLAPIALHASTQMDNRGVEDARQRQAEGFTRVVLARESSLARIREIHKALPTLNIEAFVHGALCVSYSGRCYASAYKFDRSANRGCCAQFCRLAFDLVDDDGRIIESNRHLLSLKDMCRKEDLEAMMDAGVMSFKIEGRLKDAAYVKNVTAAYRRAIDEVLAQRADDYHRSSLGLHTFTFEPDVRKSFNRGFTDYFLHTPPHAHLAQPVHQFDTPKAMGEPIGNVEDCGPWGFTIGYAQTQTAPVVAGDGLCYLHPATGRLEGLRVNRVDGQRVIPATRPEGIRRGVQLWRNHDQALDRLLSRPSATRRIPLRLTLKETTAGYILQATEEGMNGRSAQAEILLSHEAALSPQTANIQRQLGKLGDTPFVATSVEVATEGERFIPSSTLAALRREVVAALLEEKRQGYLREQPGRPTWGATTDACAAPSESEPHKSLTYIYNIANSTARRHHERAGWSVRQPAFEVEQPTEAILMTCRHCIRRALGMCLQGESPRTTSPLYLRTTDGERFPLRFDCRRCEMQVLMPQVGSKSSAHPSPHHSDQGSPSPSKRQRGRKGRTILLLCALLLGVLSLFSSCDYSHRTPQDRWIATKGLEPDSIEFRYTHHYWKNDFFMATDTMLLQDFPRTGLSLLRTPDPSAQNYIAAGDEVAVVGIHHVADTLGQQQIWVQVARDRFCKGWVSEEVLLDHSIPSRPISKFIYYFSDRSLVYYGSVLLVAALVLMLRLARKRRIPFVHFNDIRSFYPTLLCLTVATEATIYGTMQRFAPETWVEYYFHPTLNPFTPGLPLILALFIVFLWLMVLVAIATFEDLRHAPEDFGILAYLAGLAMMCVALYLVFSLSVHIYIGYPLLLAYWAFAFWRHHRFYTPHFRCGNCGALLDEAGRCPECGMENDTLDDDKK